MLIYPSIDPIAFHLGPLPVHWYGLMYLVGFSAAWAMTVWRVRHYPWLGITADQVSDLLFYIALGVILGGRIGYMIFYDLPNLIQSPTKLFMIWQGGMSFHGGLLGVMVACWLFGRKVNKTFLQIGDLIAPVIPLGLATGRIGNFINGELWGRVTDVPWGMVFPEAGALPRHPSQLYEFFLEGIVMFVVLWFFSRKPKPVGAVSGMFLVLYGCFRIFIEFYRNPDPQLGYIAWGWVTQGQLLSVPMIVFGLTLILCGYCQRGKMCFSAKI